MTTIRANCPHCGDVQLRADDLTVRTIPGQEHGSYSFTCPSCSRAVAKDASKRIIDLLVSVFKAPSELFETKIGPAINADDLLDFHLLLQDESWFEDLNQQVRSSNNNNGEIK